MGPINSALCLLHSETMCMNSVVTVHTCLEKKKHTHTQRKCRHSKFAIQTVTLPLLFTFIFNLTILAQFAFFIHFFFLLIVLQYFLVLLLFMSWVGVFGFVKAFSIIFLNKMIMVLIEIYVSIVQKLI